MPVYNFEEAQKVLAKTAIGKNLAVVICGFAYKTDEEAKQQSTWSSVLGGLGYRRVTFVRLGNGDRVNGCPILNEIKLDNVVKRGNRFVTSGF